METQKIVNLLNDTDNQNSKFATKKWYVIDSESKGVYLFYIDYQDFIKIYRECTREPYNFLTIDTT